MAQPLDETLTQRGSSYGDFTTQSVIVQDLKDTMRSGPSWDRMSPFQKEALDTIAMKISRLVNGDPDHIDSWHDIAGYAKLVESRLIPVDVELKVELVTKKN